jgi:hypothetical protein
MSKTYEITIKYLDGQVETTTINTNDIVWSLDQFIRNRKVFNGLNIELKDNGKEEKSLSR